MNTSSDKPQGDSLKRTPASEQAEQNIRETSSVCNQSAKSGLPLFMRVPRNPHDDAGAAHSCDTRKNEPKSASFGGYGSPDTITAASAPMPHMAPEPSGTGHGAPRTALDHPDKEDTSPNKGETAFEEPLSQEPDSRRAISVDPEGTAVFEPEPAQDSPSPHTPGGANG